MRRFAPHPFPHPHITMTKNTPKKMHGSPRELLALALAWLAGAAEALLLARLLARLLAARPDSPSIALLYQLTAPLVAPLALIDAGQPPFGASFERATLVLLALIPLGAYLLWIRMKDEG